MLEDIAKADAEARDAARARVLAELTAEGSDFRVYDDPDLAPETHQVPGGPGDPEAGRASRTAKKAPVKKRARSNSKAKAPLTARQKAEEKRRQEIQEQANWVRNQTA